jgi:putative ABC transport system permease protein
MFDNFLRIAMRKLWRHRVFSAINIFGLALGLSSCVFILMYVTFEQSFDNFRPSDVYRVIYYGFQNNIETGKSAQVVPAIAPTLTQDLPEVLESSRLVHTGPIMSDPVMQAGDKIFREGRIFFADSAFLVLMAYPMISGSSATALSQPNSVAVSSTIARKYFGSDEALGKMLTFHMGERGPKELMVTGVFDDVPVNSHVHTDFIVSFSTLQMNLDNNWDWGNFYTYVRLAPQTDAHSVESKIPAILEQHIGKDLAAWAKNGYTFKLFLQQVSTIHLDSHLWGEAEVNADRNQVNFLGIIAVFILVIAWVNYINFAIARSTEHVKEAGIRKISGSSQSQLIGLMLMDAALVNLTAAVLSLATIKALLPALTNLLGFPMLSFNEGYALLIAMLFLLGTFLSGFYPAYVISSYKPVALLKRRSPTSSFGVNLSRGLVVFQFTIAIILIIGTITVGHQLEYMRRQDIGLNVEKALIVKGPGIKDSTYISSLDFFRNETGQISGLHSMAVSSSIPGQELHWAREFSRKDDPNTSAGIYIVAVDENFLSLFDATFLAGRNFTDGSEAFQDAVILNETAARKLGYDNPTQMIDQTIIWQESDDNHYLRRVIGVIKDFHQQSFKEEVEPMVFALKKYLYAPWADEYYSFKLSGATLSPTIAKVESKWSEVFPGNPFDYFFLDDYFASQYKSDRQLGSVFSLFAFLSIFIACMGLFGLSSCLAIRRTKEIGVRRVLGSSIIGIVTLLSKDFLLWVAIAFVIACPLASYGINRWLQQFAYRTQLGPSIFAVAGLISMAVALATVSWQSFATAKRNPSESLRQE